MTTLRVRLEEYLAVRRILGFKLQTAGQRLHDFIDFMEAEGAPVITTRLAVAWATMKVDAGPGYWATNLTCVRLFAEYCSSLDPRTEVPPYHVLPFRHQRKDPYIYSPDEIAALMVAAKRLHPVGGLRGITYATIFGLLAATGMRVGEALGLERGDVDLTDGTLMIRNTKFSNKRILPVHHSTLDELRKYAGLRDRGRSVQGNWFFPAPWGGRTFMRPLKMAFIKLSRQVGLRGATASLGPRLHDLRHTFAVRTLLAWYQAGDDVERKLPLLSTYLGHRHPSDTYWYLSATPELMAAAAARLESAQ